ncbi:MAG: hypothetical protein ACOVKC_00300 [Brevundimonas sp.]
MTDDMLERLMTRLQDISAGSILHYHNDLLIHDRRVFSLAWAGAEFMWAHRSHGTHLIVMHREDGYNTLAADHFKAAGGDAIEWRLIHIGPKDFWVSDALEEPATHINHVQGMIEGGSRTISELFL